MVKKGQSVRRGQSSRSVGSSIQTDLIEVGEVTVFTEVIVVGKVILYLHCGQARMANNYPSVGLHTEGPRELSVVEKVCNTHHLMS